MLLKTTWNGMWHSGMYLIYLFCNSCSQIWNKSLFFITTHQRMPWGLSKKWVRMPAGLGRHLTDQPTVFQNGGNSQFPALLKFWRDGRGWLPCALIPKLLCNGCPKGAMYLNLIYLFQNGHRSIHSPPQKVYYCFALCTHTLLRVLQ